MSRMLETGNQAVQHQKEHLGVELGITLRLQLRGAKDTWKSTLVGMVRDRYLIAEIPSIPGLWVKLYQMNNIIVRYLHNGKVYGFYATLIGAMNEPFHLAFLSYPENIEIVNLRKFERTPCMIPALISMNGASYEGVFTDVSEGGCSFLFDQSVSPGAAISVGEEVLFSTRVIGSSDVQSIKATVRNIKLGDKRTFIGTQFHDLDDNLLQSIRTYMEKVGNLDAP